MDEPPSLSSSATSRDSLRVILIAEDPLVRAALSMALAAGGLAPLAEIGGADELGPAAAMVEPEIVLWDLGPDSARARDRLAELERAELPTVALVPSETHAADALAAGARGVLLRSVSSTALAAALRAAAAGLVVLDPPLAQATGLSSSADAEPEQLDADRASQATGAVSSLDARDRPSADLTARELEVLQLLATGLSNKLIAARLGISEHTAKFHVNAILAKLGVQSRTEAVVRGARLGLVIL